MSDPDRLLETLWAVDEPPAQDMGFVLAVIERVELRRLWVELAGLVGVCVAASAALWALAPLFELFLRQLIPSAHDPWAVILTGAGVMAAWLWAAVSGRAGPFQA